MAGENWAFLKNGVVLTVCVAPPEMDEALMQAIKNAHGADTCVVLNAEDYEGGHVNRPGPAHAYHAASKTFYKHPDEHCVVKVRRGEAVALLEHADIQKIPGSTTHTGAVK